MGLSELCEKWISEGKFQSSEGKPAWQAHTQDSASFKCKLHGVWIHAESRSGHRQQNTKTPKKGPTFLHPWWRFNQSLYSDVAEPVGAQRLCQCQCVLWHLAAPWRASTLRRDPTFIRRPSLCPSAIKEAGTKASEIGTVGAPVCNYLDAECGSGRPTERQLIATRKQLLHLTEGDLWIPDAKTRVSLHLAS